MNGSQWKAARWRRLVVETQNALKLQTDGSKLTGIYSRAAVEEVLKFELYFWSKK